MRLLEAKKTIKEILAPQYKRACKSAIEFCIRERDIIVKKREYLKTINSEGDEFKKIYRFLYGHYDKQTKKQVKGFIDNLPKKNFKLIMDSIHTNKPMITDKQVKSFYTKEYKQMLKIAVEGLYNEIKGYKPTSIELGNSDHDINFILSIKGTKKSFTINTIVAGGDIQCLHTRVLKKLHKSIVS